MFYLYLDQEKKWVFWLNRIICFYVNFAIFLKSVEVKVF